MNEMVKIYSKVFPLEMRRRIKEGNYGEKGISQDLIISDGHNVKDILRVYKKVAEEDPTTLNYIRDEILPIFQKSEEYYLLEGRRMLLGMEAYSFHPLWLMDVAEPFFQTLEQFIKEGKTDLDEFEEAMNANIKKSDIYKETLEQLEIMGFDFSGFEDIYK